MAIRKEIIENDKFLDESLGILSMVDFSLRHAEKHLHTPCHAPGANGKAAKEFAAEERKQKSGNYGEKTSVTMVFAMQIFAPRQIMTGHSFSMKK